MSSQITTTRKVMLKHLLIAILFLHYPTFAKESLLIENVTVVSSHLQEPLQKAHVLISDGRIKTVSSSKIEKTFDVQVIDGTALYLAPGIMDSHVHVSSIPGMGFGVEPVAQKNDALAQEYYKQQPYSFLYYGITQVVDPNPGLEWKKFTASEIHPDYYRCEVITSRSTFPLVEKNDELSKSMFSYIVEQDVAETAQNSPELIGKRIAESGASCIKIYFEDGYGDESQWPLLSDDTLKRIRKSASKHKLPLVAHANALDMYQRAIDAEVDVIAHGLWNWGEFSRETEVSKPMHGVLNQLMSKSTGYMPTQRVIAGLGELMLHNSHGVSEFSKVTPEELIEWYKQPSAQWFKEELRTGFDGLPDEVIARIFLKDRVGKGNKILKILTEADYPLLLGSDFPGSPSFSNQPGLTTFLEMKAMADAGVSLAAILAAATINNARQFNIDEDYGTVEVGKVANLLLLKQNPLTTVDAWSNIHHIILHGEVFNRSDFAADAMANKSLQRTSR
ncbi:amidohydrolase family protein [Alteromonas sp. MmMcT2-2]|uniref:amidohydrolase family protein n=1 Tax=Alteromonas sp. MmMcT2-2 TaxID=2917732 RepID=UPI001EF1B749|nr:amidohydrolase family protein [Alteromonas sp. MmMcT2-2]